MMKFTEIQLAEAIGTENEIHNYFTEGDGFSEDTKVVSLTNRLAVDLGVDVVFENGDQWLIPWSNIVGAKRKLA